MGDNDFPAVLGGSSPAVGFLQSYVRGFDDYSQAGTDIPSLRLQNKYGQERGGPLLTETQIAGSPSFDMMGPDIDSPEVDQWIKDYENSPGYTPKPVDVNRIYRNIERARRMYLPGVKRV